MPLGGISSNRHAGLKARPGDGLRGTRCRRLREFRRGCGAALRASGSRDQRSGTDDTGCSGISIGSFGFRPGCTCSTRLDGQDRSLPQFQHRLAIPPPRRRERRHETGPSQCDGPVIRLMRVEAASDQQTRFRPAVDRRNLTTRNWRRAAGREVTTTWPRRRRSPRHAISWSGSAGPPSVARRIVVRAAFRHQ